MRDYQRMNIEVLAQQMRSLDAMVREQKVAIDGMSSAIAGLSSRIFTLETVIMAERIAKMGNGPTAQ